MPLTALRSVEIDYVAASAQMAPLVVQLAGETMRESAAVAKKPPAGDDPANQFVDLTTDTPPGALTALTCPACGGALWENEEQGQLRFHCHVGHAYSAESLVQNHSQVVESAMWTALRVLNEHADLQERMKSRAKAQGLRAVAEHFRRRAEESKQQVELLRKALFSRPADEPPAIEDQSN
jgi:two-component system chemotaxis response regulator CheB